MQVLQDLENAQTDDLCMCFRACARARSVSACACMRVCARARVCVCVCVCVCFGGGGGGRGLHICVIKVCTLDAGLPCIGIHRVVTASYVTNTNQLTFSPSIWARGHLTGLGATFALRDCQSMARDRGDFSFSKDNDFA